MATVITEDVTVRIPAWVIDLATFNQWAESDEFPEEGRISFINGEVWADMSKEQLFSHVRVKGEFLVRLNDVLSRGKLGTYFGDGARFINDDAGVSNVPDGLAILAESYRNGLVRLVEGQDGGYVAVEGSPDIVLEVVSTSSVDKDYDWLMTAYYDAGVREYWLVDARATPLRFDIYRPGPKGFVATRKSAGWVKSAALGKSFRLTPTTNAIGQPDYNLDVR